LTTVGCNGASGATFGPKTSKDVFFCSNQKKEKHKTHKKQEKTKKMM